jgi:hypothetical protein
MTPFSTAGTLAGLNLPADHHDRAAAKQFAGHELERVDLRGADSRQVKGLTRP